MNLVLKIPGLHKRKPLTPHRVGAAANRRRQNPSWKLTSSWWWSTAAASVSTT